MRRLLEVEMLIDWPSIWVGAVVSILLTAAATIVFRVTRRRFARSRLATEFRARYLQRSVRTILKVTSSDGDPAMTKLGSSFEFPWVTVAFGPFQNRDINAHYTSMQRQYWPEVDKWHAELLWRQSKLLNPSLYNSPGLRLVDFTVSRTGGEERPALGLKFCDTDYYHNIVSDQRLDFQFENDDGTLTTLRKKYCTYQDLRVRPFAGNACHFGVQLAVVTQDDQLIIPVRGNTAIAPHAVAPSVAEGALPASDIGPAGEYLPYLTATRGLREELGIADESRTSWLSFGANPLTGQYGLVGLTRVDATFEEVAELHRLAITKDQWENSMISGIPFTPEAFAQFLELEKDREWSPFALIAYTHSLISTYGWRRLRDQVGHISVKVSQG